MHFLKLFFVVIFVSLGAQGLKAEYGNAGALVFSTAPHGGIDYGRYGKIKAGEPIVLLGIEKVKGEYVWTDFGGQIDPISEGVAEPAREGALREVKEEAPGIEIPLGNFHNVKSVVRKNGKIFTPGFNRDVYRPSYQMFFTFSNYISAEKIEKNAEKLRLQGKHGHVEKFGWMWVPLREMLSAFGVVTRKLTTTLFQNHTLHFVRPHNSAFYKTKWAQRLKVNTAYKFRNVFYGGFLQVLNNESGKKELAKPFLRLMTLVMSQFKYKKVGWNSDPVVITDKTMHVMLSFTDNAKLEAKKYVSGVASADKFVKRYHVTIAGIPNVAKQDIKALRKYLNEQLNDPAFDVDHVNFQPSRVSRYLVNRRWKKAPIVMLPANPNDFVSLNKQLIVVLSKFEAPSGRVYTLSSDTHADNYVPHYTIIDRAKIEALGLSRSTIIGTIKQNMSSSGGGNPSYDLEWSVN